MLTKSKGEDIWTRRAGRRSCLRVFAFSLLLLMVGFAAPALAGSVEAEERAEAAAEFLDEEVSEFRSVIRETRPQVRRGVDQLRSNRVAAKRLPSQVRGRIRICETAPLPLRC